MCTYIHLTAMFAFDAYDRDSSGVLSNGDIESMLDDLYGRNSSRIKLM